MPPLSTLQGINGGPQFPFSEAVSFTIECKDQDEVDYYWDRLTDGGEELACGWCKDRFGLSWQVIARRLYDLVNHPDPARATAATQAMYGMRKIVLAELESAAASVWTTRSVGWDTCPRMMLSPEENLTRR